MAVDGVDVGGRGRCAAVVAGRSRRELSVVGWSVENAALEGFESALELLAEVQKVPV